MKSLLKSMMLFVVVSILFSCNPNKKELKEIAEKFNKECPVPLGDIGSIVSVLYDGETVEMKFTSNEVFAPISSLNNHQQQVKEMLGLNFSKESSKELVDKIIGAGASIRTIFVGNQTGQRAEFTMTSNELKGFVKKYSNMNDQQKLIVSMYVGSSIKLPLEIDEETKLVGLSLTSDALKYKLEINDRESGQSLDSSVSFMKYIALSQIAHSLKEGIMGERNKQFYQALIDCKQGIEYEYHELQTGKKVSFRISTDEIREVLNGKWDNQPSAQDWEKIGQTLDNLMQSYDEDTLYQYDDYASADTIW